MALAFGLARGRRALSSSMPTLRDSFYKHPDGFCDAELIRVLRRVRAKQAPYRAYAAVPVDDYAKLEMFPHRCDFSKLTGMFVSALSAAQKTRRLPPATSLPMDMVRRLIQHKHDQDSHAQPLTWRSTLEFVSLEDPEQPSIVNCVTFRMANDGFLYLDRTPRPNAVSASHVMHDIAPSTSVTSIPPSVDVARVVSYTDLPAFVDIMEAARYPYPRYGSLNRPPMTGWFQLRSKTISQGGLAPMKTAFCDWIAASRDIPDCGPLNAELYYNAEYRRVDIIMTVRLAVPSKEEFCWTLCFEPGAPLRPWHWELPITPSKPSP